MRRNAVDQLVASALTDLDPAPEADLTAAERGRADVTFARIVATPVESSPPAGRDGERRQYLRRKRLLVTTGAGLVGVAGLVTPMVLLGGGSAYASWTPTPEPLTGMAASQAGIACRASMEAPDRGEQVALAEQRGEWTFVLLAGTQGEATCLMPNDVVAKQVREDRDDSFGSYTPDPAAPPSVDPGAIDQTAAMSSSTSEGWFTWTAGYVGSDVTGVTVQTSSGLDIEASVVGNRFAAWWPDNGQSWSYSVHLADGTTRRVH